ncbi:MAG: Ku protein [Clostridiales bacterium]|jgi:DNA end-binding protein Ku|nr:Ku protein [Clostridiales bacterium]HOB64881.1 Ku protein [Clostridia bacterium]
MAYSYKGSLSFGLVYIPIQLQKCAQRKEIGFNLLDKKTMSRIKYKKTCVDCGGKEVPQEDIVKGYNYEDDKYVIFEESDFEKIKTQKDKNITIERFVNLEDIDPIYYDTPYFVVPTGAENAYALLVQAMREENKVGIAKCVLGTKETLIAVRENNGQLYLNTLYFYDELLPNPAKNIKYNQNGKELEIARLIIKNMSGPFEPEQYKDEYRERLLKAIEDKIAGKEIEAPAERVNKVADLMDALQMTLQSTAKTTPAKSAQKAPAAEADTNKPAPKKSGAKRAAARA